MLSVGVCAQQWLARRVLGLIGKQRQQQHRKRRDRQTNTLQHTPDTRAHTHTMCRQQHSTTAGPRRRGAVCVTRVNYPGRLAAPAAECRLMRRPSDPAAAGRQHCRINWASHRQRKGKQHTVPITVHDQVLPASTHTLPMHTPTLRDVALQLRGRGTQPTVPIASLL